MVLPGNPSGTDTTVPTQFDSGMPPTPAAARREKAQEDAPAPAADAPGSGRGGVASSMPTLAKTIEGPASAVEVAAMRDPNAALTSSAQTTQKAPGHDGGQAAGTVRSETDPLPGGGMGELTQARVLHSLTGSEVRINLSSEEFGRVSVHTAYGREVITSQISLENSVMGNALSSALNAHLPTLVTKLGQEHGLPSSVTLAMQSGAENRGADRDQNSDPRSQSGTSTGSGQARQHGAGFSTSSLSADAMMSAGQSTLTSAEASSGRLDIRI